MQNVMRAADAETARPTTVKIHENNTVSKHLLKQHSKISLYLVCV